MNPELLRDRAERLLMAHPFPGARPEALVAVLNAAQPMRLASGAVLCKEGEAANALFFLVEGSVTVLRRDVHGVAKELATLESPALVGQMAMIDSSPRSATCVALTPVRALALERPQWLALLGEATPRGTVLRRLLLSSLSQQLGAANYHLRRLVAGTTLEDDLPEIVRVEPLDPTPTSSARALPPPPVVPAPPGASQLPVEPAPRPRSPHERAPDELSEEDLQEVTSLLEGWKRNRQA